MKKQFQSKSVPRGTRTIWRYLGALILLFSLSIGNVWAAYDTLFVNYTGTTKTDYYKAYTVGTKTVTLGTSQSISSSSGDYYVQLGSAASDASTNYVSVVANEVIESVSFLMTGNGADKTLIPALLCWNTGYDGDNKTYADSAIVHAGQSVSNKGFANAQWFDFDLSESNFKEVRVYKQAKNIVVKTASKANFPSSDAQTMQVYGVRIKLRAAAPACTKPGTPTSLAAGSVTHNSASLSWTAGSNSDGHKIYIEKKSDKTKVLDWTDCATNSYAASGLSPETTYTFKVKAKGATGYCELGDEASADFATDAAPAACPSGLTISGTAAYTEGETISLNAALSEGTGEISYQWYKGSIAAGNEVGTGATFTKANCVTGDAGNYYCVASKDGCLTDAESSAYVITVEAVSYCAELYPATTGSSPSAANQEIILQTESPNASYGGKIYTHSKKSTNTWEETFTYTSKGLQLNKSGDDKVRVELNHLLAENTVITVNMDWTRSDDKSSGVILRTGDDSQSVKTMTKKNPSGDFSDSYTIQSTDTKLIGSNSFILARSNSIGIKSITVSNCGAELHALTSAIDPVAAEGKATVTLSKSMVAAGGTATATYSDIDAAYDFDEWQISGTGATLSDSKANPVTITMGSADAVVTLKLKAASVKHTVTYYDGEAIPANKLGEELIEHNDHPTGAGLAPRKLGHTFGGWSTTEDGAAATLSDINVTEDIPLYAVWNAVNCATKSGTIYTMSIVVAPLANCTITSTTGTHDLYQYEGVSGGEALLGNKGTSNNCILQTNKKILLKDDNSYIKLDFDCPLKEGDKIVYSVESNNPVVSTGNSKPSTPLATLDRNKTEFVIPAESGLIDAQTIYIWKGGGNTTVTYINIVRPAKYDVTFNLHGHGDPIAPQTITAGGKVTEPTDPSESGWDFDGWFKTYVADPEAYSDPWDFDNDVVEAATELHAKWTEHVSSNDVSLKTLSVNGDAVTIVPSQLVYAVELPFGTTATPTVTATANDENVKAFTITQATAVDGSATIYVKAEDNTTEATYTINFSVATSKDIQLVFKTGTTPCVGTASTATQILSNNAAVSTYINQITFTNVEGAGDDGAEGSSLNVGKKAGNMFTLSAKAGYAFQAMNFLAKIQDATCEYSINGGDWTELASTSTSADECYAPFTSGTVHEFRLRSTGTSGVWIRNMQLTIIEACTPVAITWDAEPVEFEVGKSGYAIAATANNGGEIAYSSTAAAVVDVVAATGALTISGLGSATLKAATAEGDGTTYCANGGNDIEISKAVNTYYLVKFDAQNGDAATEVKYFSGDDAIALPVAPTYAGYDFQGWFDAETGGNKYLAAITPSASITVYAQWVAQCPGATITTQPVGASYLTGRTPAALVCEATAGNNGTLTYEWFTCDDALKTNPVAATATPSTAVAGTFYYFCKVMEAGCDVEAYSDVVTITVADKDPIYLAWVDVTGQNAASLDASKSLYAPEVSATGIKNSSSYGGKTGWKFNSAPGYIAIEGAPFKAGDIVEMFVTTTTADKARVFNANEAVAANVVAEGTANMVQGANKVALTADANNLYLRRGDDFDGWNPFVAYIAVYRVCAPILNKVTVAGVEAAPDNTNHVAIEVPFTTAASALDAIAYDWVSNDADWTADPANAPVAANAWEWGVENTVTFADKDGDESVYYITISKAAASSDATLSALTVNGQAIALADGVFDYTFELPYGTTEAPTVVATPNHVAAVATVDPCTVSGATITVVPESGADDKQVYTLTFTISAWKEVIIWDGSYMTELATSPGALGMAWETVGFGSIGSYNTTYGEKAYSKYLPSGGASTSRYMTLTVPEGYVAKFYVVEASHSDGSERGMFIGSNLVKDPDATSVLQLSNNDRDVAVAGMSEIVGAGTWYINPNASIDFQEIRAYLRKGMVRNSMLGNGVFGTSCVDHNVAVEDIQGATFYELQGRDYNNYGKLAFDEIVSGELEAGVPYVFQAHGDKLILFYGEDVEPAPVDKGNGMYGTFEYTELTELTDVYYFAQRALWSSVDLTVLKVPANRAYVKLSEVGDANPTPAPGRRRVTMAVNGKNAPTGIDAINASEKPMKIMIDGQIYILRGEKVFDATGRLVK